MARGIQRLVAVLAAVGGLGSTAPALQGGAFAFSPQVLEEGLAAAADQFGGGYPPGLVKFEQKQGNERKGRLMSMLPGANPQSTTQFWIHVYVDNICNQYPDVRVSGPAGSYTLGVLIGLFHHELQHCCLGDTTMSSGGTPNSCKHGAIEYSTHRSLCQQICELVARYQADPTVALHDYIHGLCAEARRLEEKWNTPAGAAKMLKCLRGEADTNFEPPANCPTQYPADPGPGGFPNGKPLPPCDCCSQVGG